MNSKYRIKKNEEFEYIIKNGSVIKNSFFVIYNIERRENYNRYGISVSKNVGNSVKRNKIKRRIKDIIIKNSIKKGYDYVIIVRKEVEGASFEKIKDKLLDLIKGE